MVTERGDRADEVSVRAYRRVDLPSLVALDRRCFAPPFLFSPEAKREFTEAAGARVVVAERGAEHGLGVMVGFAIGQMEGEAGSRVGYCVTLDVAPDERRSGLGGSLLGELERWATEEGAREMMLHVFVGNGRARRFYAGRGYREVRLIEGFYRPELHAIECRKEL